jgi:hypothetical protein
VTVETTSSGTALLQATSNVTTLSLTKAKRVFLAGSCAREFDYSGMPFTLS